MTREDIRKLIGGYATGTLTEAERKLLFEAALDDQELFEELAREQTLKEVLDEPGAKSRLIAALADPDPDPAPAWWKRPIAWATSAVAAAAVAGVVFVSLRPSQPLQVAATRTEAIATPAATPPPEPARSAAPSAARLPALAKKAIVARDAAEPLEKKAADKPDAQRNEKEMDQKFAKAEELAANGRQVVAAPLPQGSPTSPPQTEARRQVAENSTQSVSQAQVQSQPSGPAQRSQAFGGFVSGQAGAVAPATPALRAARAPRFAFDYSVEADRRLVIKAAASGYLSVAAAASKSLGLIFPVGNDGRVAAGSTTRIVIPAEVQSVVIVFSASAGARGDSTALTDAISSAKDAPSGTVEDPNPSANSKLVVELRIQP